MWRKLGAEKEGVSYGSDGFTRQHKVGKPPFSYPALVGHTLAVMSRSLQHTYHVHWEAASSSKKQRARSMPLWSYEKYSCGNKKRTFLKMQNSILLGANWVVKNALHKNQRGWQAQWEVDVSPSFDLGPGIGSKMNEKLKSPSIHLFFAASGLEPDRSTDSRGCIYMWKNVGRRLLKTWDIKN